MITNTQLEHDLTQFRSEREIHCVLKTVPLFVFRMFNPTGHTGYTISEFSLGSEFRADFVTIQAYSYGWDIRFIELEPPDDPIFNKSGTPGKRLASAIVQIDDWRSHIKDPTRHSYLRRQLSDAARDHDLIWPDRHGQEPQCTCARPLTDMGAAVDYEFYIVIGRSALLDQNRLQRKADYATNHGIHIMTYDRMASTAATADLTNPYA